MLIGTWKVEAKLMRFQWKMRVLFRISSVRAKNLDAYCLYRRLHGSQAGLSSREQHTIDGDKVITHGLGLMSRARARRSREVRF